MQFECLLHRVLLQCCHTSEPTVTRVTRTGSDTSHSICASRPLPYIHAPFSIPSDTISPHPPHQATCFAANDTFPRPLLFESSLRAAEAGQGQQASFTCLDH